MKAHTSLRLVAALVLSCSGALACASLVKRPSVRVAEVGLADISLNGATAEVTLHVTNPNGFSMNARSLDYRLAFLPPEIRDSAAADEDWRTLATGTTPDTVRLPAGDSTSVTVQIPFGYRELGQAVGSFLREGRLRYRFTGAFVVGSPVGDFRVPFDRRGFLEP